MAMYQNVSLFVYYRLFHTAPNVPHYASKLLYNIEMFSNLTYCLSI